MKNKRTKKSYNFTKRQWQRLKSERISRYDTCGAVFKKIRQKHFRSQNRYILIQLTKGKELEFIRFRKTDSWDCD